MKIRRTVKLHAQPLIIGVGGAGCSVVKNLKNIASDLDVKLLALDSSEQSLKGLSKKETYVFSQKFLRGDGVFGRWDIAQELFQKEKKEISKRVSVPSDIIFLIFGAGGGIGSGVSPLLLALLKEKSGERASFLPLIFPIVILPSNKEEQRVFYNAASSLAQLTKSADAIFFVDSDQFIEKNNPSFDLVDESIAEVIDKIIRTMYCYDYAPFVIDMADLSYIIFHAFPRPVFCTFAFAKGDPSMVSQRNLVEWALNNGLFANCNYKEALSNLLIFSVPKSNYKTNHYEIREEISEMLNSEFLLHTSVFTYKYKITSVTILLSGIKLPKLNEIVKKSAEFEKKIVEQITIHKNSQEEFKNYLPDFSNISTPRVYIDLNRNLKSRSWFFKYRDALFSFRDAIIKNPTVQIIAILATIIGFVITILSMFGLF